MTRTNETPALPELYAQVRAWARGVYAWEAGVELLIHSGQLGNPASPWINHDGARLWIDAIELMRHAGVKSGGERRVIRIAVSLLEGPPVELAEVLPGLDREHLSLVLAAVAHAGGSHEISETEFTSDGTPSGSTRLGALYPWPQ